MYSKTNTMISSTTATTETSDDTTIRLAAAESQVGSKKVEPESQKKTPLQAISQGVPLAGVPCFTSMEKKRRWMLEHMAGAFRVFARKGFTEGMSGHISLRDPERTDCFWTNPYGSPIALAVSYREAKRSILDSAYILDL